MWEYERAWQEVLSIPETILRIKHGGKKLRPLPLAWRTFQSEKEK